MARIGRGSSTRSFRRTGRSLRSRRSAPQFKRNTGRSKPAAKSTKLRQTQGRTTNTATTKSQTSKAQSNQDETKTKVDKTKTNRSLGSYLGGIGGALKNSFSAKPNAEQRKALETMSTLLGPDKLGGKDKVFNHQDRDAIVKGLMNDRSGMAKEAVNQLQNEGKNFQAKLVGRAFSGRPNRIKRKIQDRVAGEVRDKVVQQLNAGLKGANITPSSNQKPDTHSRNISFQELRDFEAASRVAEQFQSDMTKRLGFDIHFPNGLSQAAIQHTLEGRFGIPPGGVIVSPN